MDTERSRIEDAARRQAGLRMLQLPDELKYSTWERIERRSEGWKMGALGWLALLCLVALPFCYAYVGLGVLEMVHDLLHWLLK